MEIPNKIAKKIVKIFYTILGSLPMGSYQRDSSQQYYNDLDFITFKDLNYIYNWLKSENLQLISKGDKYMSFLLDGYHIDVWRVITKDEFYKTYLTHTLERGKVIYINNFLKKNI